MRLLAREASRREETSVLARKELFRRIRLAHGDVGLGEGALVADEVGILREEIRSFAEEIVILVAGRLGWLNV